MGLLLPWLNNIVPKFDIGKKVMKGAFWPYKLIENAIYPTYPMKPWFYSPFKGEKERFPRVKTYWNFIQSSA